MKEYLKKEVWEQLLLFNTFQFYLVPFYYYLAYIADDYIGSPWILITIAFFLLPHLDNYFSFDSRNPSPQQEKKLLSDLRFQVPLYLCVFSDWFFTFHLLQKMNESPYSLFDQIGWIFGAGVFSASNINVAHELIHKESNLIDYWTGSLTLSQNLYMHWIIEHLHGHHQYVATPRDPATALRNQSLYKFWVQSFFGSYASSWQIEQKRLKAYHKSPFCLENRLIYFHLISAIFPLIVLKLFGFKGMVNFLLIAMVGIMVLETINYIQHYGLQRKEISKGVYERANVTHSWNAPHRVTNYFLFKLQRHSDHHAFGDQPYQILKSYDESPLLPQSYAVCIILAFFPSKYIPIMNQTLERYKSKNFTQEFQNIVRKEVMSFLNKTGLILCLVTTISLYVK